MTEWSGFELERLELSSEWLSNPLPRTFDDVLRNLEKLERCFSEPDGSFLWTSPRGPRVWQIDGQLNDSASGLINVELKLSYDPAASDLCAAVLRLVTDGLGALTTQLVVQLTRAGIYVTVDELLKMIESERRP